MFARGTAEARMSWLRPATGARSSGNSPVRSISAARGRDSFDRQRADGVAQELLLGQAVRERRRCGSPRSIVAAPTASRATDARPAAPPDSDRAVAEPLRHGSALARRGRPRTSLMSIASTAVTTIGRRQAVAHHDHAERAGGRDRLGAGLQDLRVRSALIRVPRVSSIHIRPPPAPQQNVFLPRLLHLA